jgi:hypothetical protein
MIAALVAMGRPLSSSGMLAAGCDASGLLWSCRSPRAAHPAFMLLVACLLAAWRPRRSTPHNKPVRNRFDVAWGVLRFLARQMTLVLQITP